MLQLLGIITYLVVLLQHNIGVIMDELTNKEPIRKAPFKFVDKETTITEDEKKIDVELEYTNKNLPEHINRELRNETLLSITGSDDWGYQMIFLTQMSRAFRGTLPEGAASMNNCIAELLALQQRDFIESKLCRKIIVLDVLLMNAARSAPNSKYICQTNCNTNTLAKLSRLQNETIEALTRYRRKGEQKVTVQHVNVSNGGQAVVTGQMSTGGGKEKNGKEQ